MKLHNIRFGNPDAFLPQVEKYLCIWCERGHVLQLEMVGRLDALKLKCLWMKPYRKDVENYGLQVPAPKILYPITTCASSG